MKIPELNLKNVIIFLVILIVGGLAINYVHTLVISQDNQEVGNMFIRIDSVVRDRLGQNKTILNKGIGGLAFCLAKVGSSTGDVYFSIRRSSNDSIIVKEKGAIIQTLPYESEGCEWKELEFTPVLINEEIYLSVEYYEGSRANAVSVRIATSDVKSREHLVEHALPLSKWVGYDKWDLTYKLFAGEVKNDVNGDEEEGIHWSLFVIVILIFVIIIGLLIWRIIKRK